jgi:hypothetical protein
MDFRSVSEMLPQQRADELLPLGWSNPLGARGRDVRPRSEPDARDASLPRMDEASTMPDATYAFWHETQIGPDAAADGRWRVASKDISNIGSERVTHKQGTAPWTEAWRTGLTEWTRDTRELLGAWVRHPNAPEVAPTWQSLRQIDAQRDVDMLVWLPTWSAWRLVPRRAAPASDTPKIHPAATSPRPASEDKLFVDHRGPCADAVGGLAKAFPRYRSALAGLEVHVVDRGDVRHYLHVWGETEWQGKSNLLPQASVVFVRGDRAMLAAFYAWMRHVALPVYPVLHDAEWARDHDNDKVYDPAACGHPAVLATPVEGVAVAIVFDEDLRALRDALTTQLHCPTTTEDAPDWVPALSEPYDHPLALAAAWAVTDPRVGWRAWAARRPTSWGMNLTEQFRRFDWPVALETRRWGRYESGFRFWMKVETCIFYVRGDYRPTQTEGGGRGYETDAMGRIPLIRRLWVQAASGTSSYSSSCAKLNVELVAKSFIECAESPRFIPQDSPDGEAASVSVSLGGQETFFVDATSRVVKATTGEATFVEKTDVAGCAWSSVLAWRREVSTITPLHYPKIRVSLESFVARLTTNYHWTSEERLKVGNTVVAKLLADGMVKIRNMEPVFMFGSAQDWCDHGAPNLTQDERYGLSRASIALVKAVATAGGSDGGSAITLLERQVAQLPATAEHPEMPAAILGYVRKVMERHAADLALRFLLFSGGSAWRLYVIDTRDGHWEHVLEWMAYCKQWRADKNYDIGMEPMSFVRHMLTVMLERTPILSNTTPTLT